MKAHGSGQDKDGVRRIIAADPTQETKADTKVDTREDTEEDSKADIRAKAMSEEAEQDSHATDQGQA